MAASAPALFRLPALRRLGLSTALSSIGMMGENVVLGWLALSMTDSPFMVGVAMAARSLPLFFVGVPAGVLADRFPRHRLLMLTCFGQGLATATLGALVLADRVTFAAVVLLTLVAGAVRGVEHAARQGYVHDVVGPARLLRGLALLGVVMRAGWLVGSLAAGAVIARFGTGGAYLAVAAGFAAGGLVLARSSAPAVPIGQPDGSVWRAVVEFMKGLGGGRSLLPLMVLTAAAEMLGFAHQTLLPSLARDVLRIGPEGLGALNAARSVGGIAGLFAGAGRRAAERGGVVFLAILLSFGASLVMLAAAPYVVGVAGVLLAVVLVNAAGGLTDLMAQGLMQRSVPADLRGRAGGAWVVAIGLAPLGQLQIGALASLFGVSMAFGLSGLALVALTAAAALAFPRLRQL